MAWSDPFGLCKEEDEFCKKMRDYFAQHGGEDAKPIVEALDKDVWLLQPVSQTSDRPNSTALGYTHLDGTNVIEINNTTSFKQQVATVNHEFMQHALPDRRGHGDQFDSWTQKEARVLRHLDLGRGVNFSYEAYLAAQVQGFKLPQPYCASCKVSEPMR